MSRSVGSGTYPRFIKRLAFFVGKPASTSPEHALAPRINVVESDNIIFAEIAPDLHLDELECDLARVGQPVRAADRHINGFVLMHGAYRVIDGDLRGAAHHHPVLGAMEVLLQRELGTWFDHDALDLIARAGVDALVVAPGPVDAAMLDRLAPVLGLELLDQRLDGFGLLACRDQNGVGGGDHDHVVEAHNGRKDALVGADQRVAAVLQDGRAIDGIAIAVVLENVPDGAPAADI